MELLAWWREEADWRGYVLCAPRGDLLGQHAHPFWVAGADHYPEALADASFDPGQPLCIVPEPDNPHDPNALGVWNADRSLQVGHVPEIFAATMEPGRYRHAVSLYEHLENGQRVGLGAVVSRQRPRLHALPLAEDDRDRVERTVQHLRAQFARFRERREMGPPPDPVEQMWRMWEAGGP